MTAKRSTKKYCSSRCRVAANRAAKVKLVDDAFERLADAMSDLATLADDGENDHDATAALIAARGLLGWYHKPGHVVWWQCDRCKQSVHVEIPKDNHCSCDVPRWRRLNMLTR